MASTAQTIDKLIAQLDEQIAVAATLNLRHAKLLLAMARLHLQTERHNVGAAELSALCAVIERAVRSRTREPVPDVPRLEGAIRRHRRPAGLPLREAASRDHAFPMRRSPARSPRSGSAPPRGK